MRWQAEKRIGFQARWQVSRSSDNPKTARLFLAGLIPAILAFVGSILWIFIDPGVGFWPLLTAFAANVMGIGWGFFALRYGAKHYENSAGPGPASKDT